MIINAFLAKILIGIVYLGIITLFVWFWKKINKNPVAGGTIGFFLGFIPLAMLIVLPTKVQVVNGPQSYTTYWSYGVSTYHSQKGKSIEVNSENVETTVINDYTTTVEIEELVYGNPLYEPKVITLYEGEKAILDSEIHFFFDEAIPNQIEGEYGKYSIRYWLRE
jgi:hypothetical protein